jgi:6-phosphofructo-2-kinase / fructose-2,6-biphosphatase 2
LTPKAYGCDEERFATTIGAVDTHRPKPGKEKDLGITDSTRRKYFVEDEVKVTTVHAPQPKKEIS